MHTNCQRTVSRPQGTLWVPEEPWMLKPQPTACVWKGPCEQRPHCHLRYRSTLTFLRAVPATVSPLLCSCYGYTL